MSSSDPVVDSFRETFRLDDLTFHEQQGWAVSVRPGQITLGSMVISSTRGRRDFQDLDPEEVAGLGAAFASVERLATSRLGAVRVNLVCLMMKDPIVHFHVVPRYSGPVERYGEVWTDHDWPGPPTFGGGAASDEILERLRQELSSAL